MKGKIETERLLIRSWSDYDGPDALAIYGDESVTRWLTPAMDTVPDLPAMRGVLRGWQTGDAAPVSHWAIELRGTDRVVGGVALLRLAPWEDLEIAWQLAPTAWGNGYAAEAGEALAHWSMHNAGVQELFALVGPGNARAAATAQRIGMDLVGTTDKYHHQHLDLYRLRHDDLAYNEEYDGDVEGSTDVMRSERR